MGLKPLASHYCHPYYTSKEACTGGEAAKTTSQQQRELFDPLAHHAAGTLSSRFGDCVGRFTDQRTLVVLLGGGLVVVVAQ